MFCCSLGYGFQAFSSETGFIKHWKTSFEKKLFFCVGEYAEYGFDQQRLIWYVCRLWDMVYSTGDQHTNISTFVDQTHIYKTLTYKMPVQSGTGYSLHMFRLKY